ncbi:MAG: hypothetical protein HN913_06365 [Candidatus Marinimicrobia bacterium]|jgi:hypothetical protein|nr:hypothetical protein [Candidatus Neomarinimicrobiota bacterium]MBT5355589.1 hypothetical protein [Candidatus Neomarinimicrobiota bacterium]MBT6737875.1 hypothetical protein [Candidatus Neomarinimicrobiota bacterium]MBT6914981.1 hypothetical protein [Candidatus Neomarinimicrobiota bacterium]MBT7185473.1 hypothetical protein [Candidatus Neomarinimicrobiota bacterium]
MYFKQIGKYVKRNVVLYIMGFSLFFTGCMFYSMAGSIPPHIKSIAIPLLENETAEFGVAEDITDGLIEEFTQENILRVVDFNLAHSALQGKVIKIADGPHTFNQDEVVSEYRYSITLQLEWNDLVKGETLITKKYTAWGAYGLSGDISTDGIDNDGDGKIDELDDDEFGEPRAFATQVAVRKIAEDILNDIVSTW